MVDASFTHLPIPTIEGENQALGDVPVEPVRAALEASGAVLLRGFATTVADFGALGQRLCRSSLFNESGNRALLDETARVQSVNLGLDPFPLHSELAREPWRPDLAMFSCLGPPSVGGQTNLCDGIAIAEGLPPQIRAAMDGRDIIYIKPTRAPMLRYWLGTDEPSDALLANPPEGCPYWFRRSQGQVLRGFRRALLERTIFQDRPAFANFILFARDYLRLRNVPLLDDGSMVPDEWVDAARATARKLTYAHAWQTGDVLVADNSRYMHGRRAIADPGERKIATYFGYLRGVGRRPGEPRDPIWRREDFAPPGKFEAHQ